MICRNRNLLVLLFTLIYSRMEVCLSFSSDNRCGEVLLYIISRQGRVLGSQLPYSGELPPARSSTTLVPPEQCKRTSPGRWWRRRGRRRRACWRCCRMRRGSSRRCGSPPARRRRSASTTTNCWPPPDRSERGNAAASQLTGNTAAFREGVLDWLEYILEKMALHHSEVDR